MPIRRLASNVSPANGIGQVFMSLEVLQHRTTGKLPIRTVNSAFHGGNAVLFLREAEYLE
jgi:hypothetical protein